MSREIIAKLARDIKEKDKREILEKEHQLHVAKVIAEKAPALWVDLGKKLEEDVGLLRADLGTPAADGDLKISKATVNQIVIIISENSRSLISYCHLFPTRMHSLAV